MTPYYQDDWLTVWRDYLVQAMRWNTEIPLGLEAG